MSVQVYRRWVEGPNTLERVITTIGQVPSLNRFEPHSSWRMAPRRLEAGVSCILTIWYMPSVC